VKPPVPKSVQTGVTRLENDPTPPRNGKNGVISFDDAPPPPRNGQSGVISFDDDPPPATKPRNGQLAMITFDEERSPARTPLAIPMGAAAMPNASDLQRQIKAVCGRQGEVVSVESQRDGTVNIRVKVPNSTVEGQLSGRILAIPGMSSPKVHLVMDVGP
jgi:hypothetical protein